MKERIRVIVDTNVVVSGIISENGYPVQIIDAWLHAKFQPIICKILQKELNDVFCRFKITKRSNHSPKAVKKILGALFNKAEKIKPKELDANIPIDIKDIFLLELACSAKADIVVTGDTELLEYANYKGIKFLSPKNFCKNYL